MDRKRKIETGLECLDFTDLWNFNNCFLGN